KRHLNSRNFVVCFTATLLTTTSAWSATESWQQRLQDGDDNLREQKLTAAEDSYRMALKEISGIKHSPESMADCLEKLANVLALQDKTEQAISLYRRALHILEARYGTSSPEIVHTLFAIGSIYESEGNPTPAMALYKRAMAINEKNYGPYSPAVANTLHRLGRATGKAGKPGEAEKHYKESLSILMQQPGYTASHDLEGLLSDYSDLLRKSETSDQDLVSDFQNEFLKNNTGTHDVPNLPRDASD